MEKPATTSNLANPDLLLLIAQLCLTLCDPIDRSPPGSSVHEIFHENTGVGSRSLSQGIFLT